MRGSSLRMTRQCRGNDNSGYSGFTPDDLITLAHFSVSRAISAPSSAGPMTVGVPPRSEEHTSELQSLRHLVCRLLLEKKKKKMKSTKNKDRKHIVTHLTRNK